VKIVIIIDSLGSGGAERQCVVLAIALKHLGHEPVILGYHYGDHFKDELDDQGISYELIIENNPILRIYKFRRKIRQIHPKAIIAFLQTSALLAELASIPCKPWRLVVSERNSMENMLSTRTQLHLQFHRLADGVTTNSQSTSDEVKKLAPYLQGKIHTIYNGVDMNRFCPPEVVVKHARKKIVVVASHVAHKNAKNLILAMDKLLRMQFEPMPQIFWYGSDQSYNHGAPSQAYSETKHLIKELRMEEDFILMPPVIKIEDVYRSCDALLLCSFWEGLPNVVCEGMSSGLPILMSRVSDFELLTKNNGACFDPHSVDEIADVLQWFCMQSDDAIAQMRAESRRKALQYFTIERMALAYLSLIT
jgi:glycosyltransferase involved in cell wall biosynthesis